MANTTNFGWETPDDTDLVKDGAAAMRTLGNSIDASFVDLKGGTTGQVLAKASNTDLDFTWSSVDPLTILDAKGDLISATAADTPARLAVGADNTVLTADSSTATGLKWATASSGGMTQLATGTLSGASISITSISQSYKNLQLHILNSSLSSAGALLVKINNTGTGYLYYVAGRSDGGTIYSTGANGQSSINLTAETSDMGSAYTSNNFFVNFFAYTSTSTKTGTWNSWYNTQGNNEIVGMGCFSEGDNTAAITQINIIAGSGTFDNGTYTLYGVS